MSQRLAFITRLLKRTWLGRIASRVYRVFRPSAETLARRQLQRVRRMSLKAARRGPAPVANDRKRILINSHFVWNYGPVEYALGAALRARGHEVTMVACGGLPDYCQLQNSSKERPPCDLCLSRIKSRFDAFQLPFTTMATYYTADDVEYARVVATDTPLEGLQAVTEQGINVGQLAYFNLFQYFKGPPYVMTPEVEQVFRRCVSSAILVTRASGRIMKDLNPDVVVTVNGKFLHWAPFLEHAKRAGIPFVTWEDYQITPSTVTFATNEIAHEQRYSETWEMALAVPLNPDQQRKVREHFHAWSTGTVTPWAGFGEEASKELNDVRELLGLTPERPVISLFPNISWDSSSVGFETAFTSVFDWLTKTIEYASGRPDMDFVIRAHPAEGRLPPEWRSPMTTCTAIRELGPPLPPNVRLVDANDPVNSYALAAISSVAMTYTSTLGMELPMRGIRPWVAAGPYYAGKGFSVDLESPDHMYSLLDANAFPAPLTNDEIERAERMAYLIRFRGTFEFPFLDDNTQLQLTSWSDLGPGGNETIDVLCDRVLHARPMIDIRPAP